MADGQEDVLTSGDSSGILDERRIKHDTDGFLSFWYKKNGNSHRRVLARVREGKVFIKDPGSGDEILVGRAIKAGGVIIIIF